MPRRRVRPSTPRTVRSSKPVKPVKPRSRIPVEKKEKHHRKCVGSKLFGAFAGIRKMLGGALGLTIWVAIVMGVLILLIKISDSHSRDMRY